VVQNRDDISVENAKHEGDQTTIKENDVEAGDLREPTSINHRNIVIELILLIFCRRIENECSSLASEPTLFR
jgi:hypothetical protein